MLFWSSMSRAIQKTCLVCWQAHLELELEADIWWFCCTHEYYKSTWISASYCSSKCSSQKICIFPSSRNRSLKKYILILLTVEFPPPCTSDLVWGLKKTKSTRDGIHLGIPCWMLFSRSFEDFPDFRGKGVVVSQMFFRANIGSQCIISKPSTGTWKPKTDTA